MFGSVTTKGIWYLAKIYSFLMGANQTLQSGKSKHYRTPCVSSVAVEHYGSECGFSVLYLLHIISKIIAEWMQYYSRTYLEALLKVMCAVKDALSHCKMLYV